MLTLTLTQTVNLALTLTLSERNGIAMAPSKLQSAGITFLLKRKKLSIPIPNPKLIQLVSPYV